MVNLTVFVEGGGNKKASRSACRKGFETFVKKAGLQGRMPEIRASGSRHSTYKEFARACKLDRPAILLVDAEGSVSADQPWEHLKRQDKWRRPKGATNEQCHLMVQVMESWFLANKDALAKFYGRRFNAGALPKNPNIERISKRDVEQGLNHATKNTQKRKYDKGSNSFDILAQIDPAKVRKASPFADRFIKTLLGEDNGQ